MTTSKFPAPKEILKNLSNAFGPSGHEDDVRAYVKELITPLVDEIHVDVLGNLIAHRKGAGKRLMLDAHTDEVGLIVRYISKEGYLKFAPLGGWDSRLFAGQRVQLRTREGQEYHGVIGMAPPHVLSPDQADKTIKTEDYFIDIGAESANEVAERGVNIGDPGVLESSFTELAKNVYLGKAFDDRAGCLMLILLLKAMKDGEIKTDMDVYANFATSEELGLRGAGPAAFGIAPDVALALEGTIGADMPGVPEDKQPCAQRKGPVITMIDKSVAVPKKMTDFLMKCAKETNVPYQVKMPIYGGTNAGAIHQARAGVLCGSVAIPCRYIHSSNSTIYWPDVENTVKLLKRAVENIHTIAG
ncbi:M42 family metallopeptidase [bacterium]|nr:M42 family metallopeptidase [bacterium]MBU1637506.1 M42 family metallopeptidase [bacterium]RQW00779.1 MAG: M42 family peptidase [bacterium]